MVFRVFPRRWWLRLFLVVAAVVFLPYGFSRMASTWRCISIHRLDPDQYALNCPIDGNAPGTNVGRLRIMSYNIAHGRGAVSSNWDGGSKADRLARLHQIANLLREVDADIVVLNEVDFDSSWSQSLNQAQFLAKTAGYPYWAEQRNLDFRVLLWTWRFGNVVISKHPIRRAELIALPAFAQWETVLAGQKHALVCDIDIGSRSVRVIAAHLSPRSEAVRVASAKRLLKVVEDSPSPTFLAGDLNATPGSFPLSKKDGDGNNAMDVLLDSQVFRRPPLELPVDSSDFTFSTSQPASVIDWILAPAFWTFESYSVFPTGLSDHLPVVADTVPYPSPF